MAWWSRPGWRSFGGLVFSAVLLGVYSRGGYGYWLGFIALVPWLLTLNAMLTLAGIGRSGVMMSIAFVAAVFAWFGIAMSTYTGTHTVIGISALLIAAPLLQPQLLIFVFVRHITARRYGPVITALAGASAWVASEHFIPKVLNDTLGHGMYPSTYLRQMADLGGAAGISFLLILVNECIALAIMQRRDSVRTFVMPLVMAILIIGLMAGYGGIRLSMLAPPLVADEKPLRIGMVQSNIVGYEQLRREMGAYDVVRHVLDTHFAMSREAIEQHQVDALLWSETVYPTTFAKPKSEGGAEFDREIFDFVNKAGVPLLFGTYDRDDKGEYNAAAFVEPSTGMLASYRKTQLFPLTEYVPPWLDGPTFRRWLPWAGTWKKGDGARVFPLRLADGREIPVLPMICLDDVDTALGIDGARLGAQVILGMSNDSWFTKHPIGANLHLNVAAFRSIETRLPQMRVTSNGISAVIDSSGAVIASTGMDQQALLVGEVAVQAPRVTLMVMWGNWVGRAGIVFLFLLALINAVAVFKRRAPPATNTAALAATADDNFNIKGIFVLTPFWRMLAGVLRMFAYGGLLWMVFTIVIRHDTPINTLTQIWMFLGLVLAPAVAAWSILRVFSATVFIENAMLVLQQRERRIEIQINDIAAVEAWKFPLPSTGLSLRLMSGKWISYGIALADPVILIHALIRAGGQPLLTELLGTRIARYTHARLATPRWRIDHPIIKFGVFSLLPAMLAFRLHQYIAFGGAFGEYYTYGLKAYLIAFAIWWATWAIGLLLFAAVLRVVIEVVVVVVVLMLSQPEQAIKVRQWLETAGRLLFYVGVPIFLLLHFSFR